MSKQLEHPITPMQSGDVWRQDMLELNTLLPCWKQLRDVARAARQQAWAPYSKFCVGAAVLSQTGDIFGGCNVENSSYGLTICAERVALCTAITAGHRIIQAVCVSLTGVPVPCGACRQCLSEFNPQMLVLLDDRDLPDDHLPEAVLLSDLLPRAFRLEHLQP